MAKFIGRLWLDDGYIVEIYAAFFGFGFDLFSVSDKNTVGQVVGPGPGCRFDNPDVVTLGEDDSGVLEFSIINNDIKKKLMC